MKKTKLLKQMITSSKLDFIMEAHNGISAKIVEEAGFQGIWGSGLTISASLGVRDNNEASWTQILDVMEFMNDATRLPILLDGDTGYGNFNNMRRLVRKLEQRGVAGVCIEDKLFPKTNSFISGETQPLADMDEFCGKIQAAKETQSDDDFCVVARLESFIAGWGLDEALRRAEAYRLAGADAILVHSKKADSSDIEAFMREWGNRHPVVIVPTKYYSTPSDRFRELGINMVIWANHTLRSAIHSMQQTVRQIYKDQSLINVEGKITTVSEIFKLQGADELKEAEKKYLPTSGKNVNALILAASQGNLGELTREIPKTLLKVSGKPILSMQVDDLNKVGIKDISVVRGFAKENVKLNNISTIDNDQFASTQELYSLYLAKDKIGSDTTVISYGDIIYKNYILNDLLNDTNDITIVVDADAEVSENNQDLVVTEKPYSKNLYSSAVKLVSVSKSGVEQKFNGEFIGLWKVSAQGADIVKTVLERLSKEKDFHTLTLTDLFNELVKIHSVAVRFIKGDWLDVDTIVDLQKAGEML
ncbi:phosphoenolpyruvate mutase [Paenibacillus jamilae]|jgi:phosphoenolpyruvate phosphomutase|uniref:phosphoenolpyruvate mutase n=1 Tax=Paenibacillus polymyxa TaxID=1406 RepID=A0AAP4A667_PAEPO|nr:phosphoenolpyruvate mutase [Paenibacillus polymyxa]MDH2333479.1 phosphoenolpyruvate mutase [Paenibacillus polymyxa]